MWCLLLGWAIILAVIWDLASLDMETTFHAAFTRAEEVGFLGAWQVGQKWPYPDDAVFVSVETSRPVNGSVMGGGPIVRVGDRLSVFDGEAVAAVTLTAAEQGLRAVAYPQWTTPTNGGVVVVDTAAWC